MSGSLVAVKKVEQKPHERCMELDVMRRLPPSPFLVRLRLRMYEARHVYIAMDFFKAGDLLGVLQSRPRMRMTLRGAQTYMGELVLALQHMHDNGFMHMDIKPENIMVTSSGHIKLGDFGFSRPWSEDGGDVGAGQRGTVQYMAPEQVLANSQCGYKVDFWQTGCVLFELYAGHPPFYVHDTTHMSDRDEQRNIESMILSDDWRKSLTSRAARVDSAAKENWTRYSPRTGRCGWGAGYPSGGTPSSRM